MKHIKIGHINYQIYQVKRLQDGGNVLYGQIDYAKSHINLDKDMDNQHGRQTMWHEAIHAILYHAGVPKLDEQLVDILASGIMQIINDNPKMGEKP